LPGEIIEIADGDQKYTLFLPHAMDRRKDVALTLHFHSAQWHAIQEHLDRGLNGPLIAFYPGEGSSVYAKSFGDRHRLTRWIGRVEDELRRRSFPAGARVRKVDVTSFSAGYGAVRELVKDPYAFGMLRRVILADSLYGSLDPAAQERTPAAEHIEVWLPLARAAMAREKTFAITFSAVKTPTYASSSECAAAIVRAVGGQLHKVPVGTVSATLEPQFPLLSRFDSGFFHVWGYGGEDAQAHMTHARHLGSLWQALDTGGRL
jgi:hypothetical protein